MPTEQSVTVAEFIEDISQKSEVETKSIIIKNIPMQRNTSTINGNVISTIIYNDIFHSIIVKHKTDEGFNAYVFYNNDASIEDMNKNYNDILDLEKYDEGYLCIHEQSVDYQNDYLNDIIERAYAIIRNEPMSDTVPVFFNLDDDLYETLHVMADEQDITINDLVQKVIAEELEKLINNGKDVT
jgi:predicted HicB family RNase H-like nuclease